MPCLAVREGDVVHIYNNGKKVLSVPSEIYDEVRSAFSNGILLTEDQVIRPNAVINYLEESNPILLETEIQIEKNKERRRMRNTLANILPWVMAIAIILIAGAVAFVMIKNAGSGVAQAVKTVVHHSAPTIGIKLIFWLLGG